MIRHHGMAAFSSAIFSLVAAMALRAADPTLAVAGVAALVVLLTWFAQLHVTDEQGSGGLVNPAAVVTLAVVRRHPWTTVLPMITAHVVGAVAGGLVALSLDDQLGDTLIFANPSLVVAAVGAFVVGLAGAWATLSVDGGGASALAGVPALLGGAVLPLGLLAAFQPAVTIGLATAGVVPWDVALIAATATLVASVVGAYAVSILVPRDV